MFVIMNIYQAIHANPSSRLASNVWSTGLLHDPLAIFGARKQLDLPIGILYGDRSGVKKIALEGPIGRVIVKPLANPGGIGVG